MSVRPSPSALLDNIRDTYISSMDNLINRRFTAYDLIVLIYIIAYNLNTFFEDFLYNHPTIKFKVNKDMKAYYTDDLLKYQSKFVKLIQDIRHYIHKFGVSYKKKPKKGDEYFDASTIVYNGVLDGTQKGIEENYAKSPLNFFTNKSILSLEEINNLPPFYRRALNDKIYLGSFASVNDNLIVGLNGITIELNEILQDFFFHIQSIGIKDGVVGALDEEKEYIKDVKATAINNYRIISNFSRYTLQPAIA